MRNYSYIQTFLLAFFSRDLYRDVARNWRGTGFAYLFVLLIIGCIPLALHTQWYYTKLTNQVVVPLARQLPTMTMKDNKLSIDKPSPYIINAPDTPNQAMIIFDTSGKTTSLEGTPAFLLFTADKVHIRQEDNVSVRKYDGMENMVVTPDRVVALLQKIASWLGVISYPVLLVLNYVLRILLSLIFAGIGAMVAGSLQRELPYSALLRLAVVATTPAIILHIILQFVTTSVPFLSLWYILLPLAYLIFGIWSNKPEHDHNMSQTAA